MDFPVYLYVIPVVFLAAIVVPLILRRRGMAATTHATLGALAARLGLQVVEGDPSTNLYYLWQPNRDFTRTLRLEGAPYGRRVTLEYTEGQKTTELLVYSETTHRFGCWLVLDTHGLGDFEVTLRQPNEYLLADQALAHLGGLRTGDPQLDAMFCIRGTDPTVATRLAPALRSLATHAYVHVLSRGRALTMPMTKYGLPMFVEAAEAYLLAMEGIAATLEGRGVPQWNSPPTRVAS